MSLGRFWFLVDGVERFVDFYVDKGDSPDFVARWVLVQLPMGKIKLKTGRWIPTARRKFKG